MDVGRRPGRPPDDGTGARMSVLVVGGAAYVGCHVARALIAADNSVVVFDSPEPGRDWVDTGAEIVRGTAEDQALLTTVLEHGGIDTVVWCPPDSLTSPGTPLELYRSGFGGMLALAESCRRKGVERFVAVLGGAVYDPDDTGRVPFIPGTHPDRSRGAIWGMVEQSLADMAKAGVMEYVAIRHCHVVGSAEDLLEGAPIPRRDNALDGALRAALGSRAAYRIYGTNHDTPDGTMVRDYIHVEDLADGVVCAVSYLMEGGTSLAINCGYGKGFSARSIGERVRRVSGVEFPIVEQESIPGDVPRIVLEAARFRDVMGWSPRFGEGLTPLVRRLWRTEKKRERRFAGRL